MTEKTKLHILCIEDDRGEARLFQKHLERAGHRVDLAYDGQEGLAKLEAGAYDAVVIDHLMPGCTGLEVLHTLDERGPLPPTIMVTGAGDERTAVEAMKLGADDYLVKDVGGGHLSLLPTIIDRVREKRQLIKERQEALDALRESERLYRTLVETTADAIVLHDEEGRITFANRAALALSDLTEEEVLGQSIDAFMRPDERADMVERRESRLAGDREDHLYEVGFANGEGKRVEVNVQSTPIFDGETFQGELIVARDVTELRHVQRRVQRQEQLTALGQMASGIAHSFRNLLNTIILYAELDLRRSDLPAGVAKNLQTILHESQRASDLVQQILDFSSRAMIRRETVDLAALIRDLLADLRPEMPDNIEISLTCEPQAAAGTFTASADPARLRQALTNLATNARDAMPHGGELRFELSSVRLTSDGTLPVADAASLPSPPEGGRARGGEWIRLAISDTGTGMTEEVRSHLFSPFFTTKDIDRGTGMGLSQVYGIVRQHGGAIDVETELGRGTTFTIYLPTHDAAAEAEGAGPATRPEEAEQQQTVLLVALDEQSRQVGESMLASLGYRVLVARNAKEALALCQSPRWVAHGAERVALALVDLEMPGVETERWPKDLKRAQPGIEVLGMTSEPLEEAEHQALREAGFAGVVRRPFEPDQVAWTLRQTMEV
jgi:PAS domain S-box-containing protein